MNLQYTGPGGGDATAYGFDGKGALMASNGNKIAVQSMPLCMSLQQDHKLKHQGRLQYGLFLKGAGMTLEEHTLFFQREFMRIMMVEQFSKQYAYSIWHIQDKERNRASYTPCNCMKIIMGNPPQDGAKQHECPYRHYGNASLGMLLGQLKIGGTVDRDVIVSHKRDRHYQLACARHFKAVHPGATLFGGMVNLNGVGNHLNAWFTASVSYHNAMSGKA